MPPLGISFCAELVGELRFGGSQFSGMILSADFGGRTPVLSCSLWLEGTRSVRRAAQVLYRIHDGLGKVEVNHPIGCCLFMEFTFSSNAGR